MLNFPDTPTTGQIHNPGGVGQPSWRWDGIKWVPYAGAGGNVIGPSTWTPGSVVFATTATQIGQDNPQLFWDDLNNRLGVGTATPGSALHVEGSITAVHQVTGTGGQSLRWAEPGAGGYISVAPSIPPIMFDLSNSTNIVKSGIQAIVQVRHPGGGALPPTPIMNVQGMAVQIFTPPDNGGDCSGFFAMQTGGGNAASFFNLYGSRPSGYEAYPDNGNAIEAQSDGTKKCIFVGLQGPGTGIMAVQQSGGANASFQSFTGDTGRAFVAQSLASKSPNNDGVLTVVNYAGTQQTVNLDYDGNFNTLGNASFAGGLYVSGVAAFGSGAASRSPPKMLITGTSGGFNGAGTSGILQLTTGNGAVTSNMLELGYVDSTYGYIQSVKPGTATQTLALNPSGGNVGIGTTGAIAKLHVAAGDSDAIGFLAGTTNAVRMGSGSTTATVDATNAAGNALTRMTVRGSEVFLAANNTIGFGHVAGTLICYTSMIPSSNNALVCGASGNTWANVSSTTYTNVSDPALKRDIAPAPSGALDRVMALEPKVFRWKKDEGGMPLHRGFMAPDVRRVMGQDFAGATDDGIAYHELTAVLWQAVQELAAKVGIGEDG